MTSSAQDGDFIPSGTPQTSIGGEFLKFDRVGVAAVGRVVRYEENDNGAFAVFSPVIRRDADGKMGEPVMESNVSITAGLRGLLTSGMIGKWLVLRYASDDMEKGKKGNALKVFERWVIDEESARRKIGDDKLVDYALANNEPDPRSGSIIAPRPRKTDDDKLPF